MFSTKSLEKQMIQPKIWVHTEKSPPHRFAHSSRCVYCMSIRHRSEKCSTKNPPFATPVPLG